MCVGGAHMPDVSPKRSVGGCDGEGSEAGGSSRQPRVAATHGAAAGPREAGCGGGPDSGCGAAGGRRSSGAVDTQRREPAAPPTDAAPPPL